MISKWVFGDNEKRYWLYYNRKYGFKATGLLKYLAIVVLICSSLMVCLNLNSFVKFKAEKIEINAFDSYETTSYGLENITQIIHYQKTIAPNGNIVKKPHYAIVFDDSFQWRTNDDLRTPNVDDEKIIRYLLRKTGLQMEEIEVDERQ